jgi:hypothetical protein
MVKTVDLRDAVAETLRDSSSGNALCADDNLDLKLVSGVYEIPIPLCTDLHRTVVHLDAVELVRGLSGASWLGEDNSGSATATATRSVGEHDLLDGSYGFAEVVLNEFQR